MVNYNPLNFFFFTRNVAQVDTSPTCVYARVCVSHSLPCGSLDNQGLVGNLALGSCTLTLMMPLPYMRDHGKHFVLLSMCSSSEVQSIYKLSLFKGPEVTRLFTFLEANFYLQPSLLLTKYIHSNPCF